jgi:hypothetical protein
VSFCHYFVVGKTEVGKIAKREDFELKKIKGRGTAYVGIDFQHRGLSLKAMYAHFEYMLHWESCL